MATQVITVLVDDLDGSEAVVTRRITVDGRSVRVDLNAEHSARLDAALEPFLAAGSVETAGSVEMVGAGAAPDGARGVSEGPADVDGAAGSEGNGGLDGRPPATGVADGATGDGGTAPAPEKPGRRLPTIRGWARANGFDLKERGRIPAEVLRAYADHVTR